AQDLPRRPSHRGQFTRASHPSGTMGDMALAPSPDIFRFGFHLTDEGAAFALYAPYATRVELCLFDDQDVQTAHDLNGPTAGIWHGVVPGVEAGQRYGVRVHGAWDPDEGHRHNPSKLLVDPYARGLHGRLVAETEPGAEAILSQDNDTD